MARKRNNPDELVQRPSLSCSSADVKLLKRLGRAITGKENASAGLREALKMLRHGYPELATSTDESPAK